MGERDHHSTELVEPTVPESALNGDYAKPSVMRYYVLAVGCSLALLVYVHRLAFTRGQTMIQEDLHFDDLQMGNFASAFLMAYGIFQVPCGLISDRFGARNILTLLMLGASLVTGAVALTSLWPTTASQFAFLLGARFVFGALQAGVFPAWSRVVTDWIPLRLRASAQGLVWMSSRFGGAIVPFIVVWMFRYFGTWTTPFWVLGAVGILWCVAFWLWFRNRPEEMPSVNAAERQLIALGRPKTEVTHERVPWRAMFGSVSVWALCLMYGFVGFAGNFMTNLLPNYLRNTRELSDDVVSQLSSLPLAFGMVSCFVGGYLSDWISHRWGSRKWGRRFNGAIGLVFAGAALAAVPWVNSVWLLAFVLCASFFCNDLNMAPAWAASADIGDRYAGTLGGAMNMTGNFIGAAGTSFAGWMIREQHSTSLFAILGCSYVIAALCWLFVDVTKPLQLEHNHEER